MRQVHHPRFGDGTVTATSDDRFTVLFAEHGYKMLDAAAVREHDLLEPVEGRGA